MDQRILRVFLLEVERQCRFALVAADDLRQALKTSDTDRVWYSAQMLLVSAANVSKLLWPSCTESTGRGDTLRRILDVNEQSPLASRGMRNHFEHFDERLEEWAKSCGGVFVDSNIGPPNMIRIGKTQQRQFLRNLDPATLSLTFRDDRWELKPIIESIHDLHVEVRARLRSLT